MGHTRQWIQLDNWGSKLFSASELLCELDQGPQFLCASGFPSIKELRGLRVDSVWLHGNHSVSISSHKADKGLSWLLGSTDPTNLWDEEVWMEG